MSLNDEALDELNEESDYLTEAEGEASKLGTVRVVAEDELDLAPPKDIDAAISALSNYDVEIQTTKDDITKIHELSDIASTVLAQETISSSDAEEVNRVYGGLYENVASPKEYTQTPSSINLKETKAYVEDKLAEAKESAIARHKDYIQKTFSHAKCLLQCLNETLVPELFETLEAVRRQALSDLSLAATSKKFIIYTKPGVNDKGEVTSPPRLIDLKTLVLYDSVKREEYDLPESLQCLPNEDDIRKLREVFHSDLFRKLMKQSDIYRDVLESLHRVYHDYGEGGRPEIYSLTYLDLLMMLSCGKIESYLKDAFAALTDVSVNAEAVVNSVLATTPSEEELSESALAVSDFYERLLLAENFRMQMTMFVYRAKPVLDGFRAAL